MVRKKTFPDIAKYSRRASGIICAIKGKKTSVDKSEAVALACASFACGVIIGFLISPARAGFGNNIDNTTNNYYFDSDKLKS